MVVYLAVRLSFTFEEVPSAKFLGAVVAGEMLRMPGFPEGRDDLTHDGLVASAAASLLARVDSLATHISLKVAKHIIEVLLRGRARLRLGRFGRVDLLWRTSDWLFAL